MQILETIRQWWRIQLFLRKLEALGQVTTAELARDIAIPEADFRRLASRSDTDSALLRRLLQRLGVDPEHLTRRHAAVMRDMAVVCSRCTMTRRLWRPISAAMLDSSEKPPRISVSSLRPVVSAPEVGAISPNQVQPRERLVVLQHANVRSGPVRSSASLRVAPIGAIVTVFRRDGRWIEVGDEQPWGWVNTVLLKKP